MKKLLLGLVLVLLGVSSYGVLQMEAAPTRYRNQQVVVFRGDSLWGIARRYTRPEEDVREVIDRIAKANHLDLRQAIQPGQKLTVPVKQGKPEKQKRCWPAAADGFHGRWPGVLHMCFHTCNTPFFVVQWNHIDWGGRTMDEGKAPGTLRVCRGKRPPTISSEYWGTWNRD